MRPAFQRSSSASAAELINRVRAQKLVLASRSNAISAAARVSLAAVKELRGDVLPLLLEEVAAIVAEAGRGAAAQAVKDQREAAAAARKQAPTKRAAELKATRMRTTTGRKAAAAKSLNARGTGPRVAAKKKAR